jgi:hypothetical protein
MFAHKCQTKNLAKNIEKIDRGTLFVFYTITSNEDPKELKGIEGSKLIDTAHQLSKDLSKENTPLIDLIKEDPLMENIGI